MGSFVRMKATCRVVYYKQAIAQVSNKPANGIEQEKEMRK